MLPIIILFLAIAALGVSIRLGSKWRKEPNLLLKEVVKSQQNMSMGTMTTLIAIYFYLSMTSSILILIIAFILLMLGLVNLVQGIRMYRHYVKQIPTEATK